MEIKQNLVSSNKYSIKCPYNMTPKYITVHNTDNANAASAKNEVSYMISNNNKVSFHVAVDDIEAIQGIPFNRNAWAAGDGNGKGNRESIHVEICKNKLGANNATFKKCEDNAVKICAKLLKQFGLGIDRLKPHKYWSGKNCPSTTNFNEFKAKVEKELNGSSVSSASNKYKNGDYNRKARTTANLNIRTERNTSSKIVKTIPKGTILEVNYCLSNWFSTYDYKYNNKPCYVSGDYIEFI